MDVYRDLETLDPGYRHLLRHGGSRKGGAVVASVDSQRGTYYPPTAGHQEMEVEVGVAVVTPGVQISNNTGTHPPVRGGAGEPNIHNIVSDTMGENHLTLIPPVITTLDPPHVNPRQAQSVLDPPYIPAPDPGHSHDARITNNVHSQHHDQVLPRSNGVRLPDSRLVSLSTGGAQPGYSVLEHPPPTGAQSDIQVLSVLAFGEEDEEPHPPRRAISDCGAVKSESWSVATGFAIAGEARGKGYDNKLSPHLRRTPWSGTAKKRLSHIWDNRKKPVCGCCTRCVVCMTVVVVVLVLSVALLVAGLSVCYAGNCPFTGTATTTVLSTATPDTTYQGTTYQGSINKDITTFHVPYTTGYTTVDTIVYTTVSNTKHTTASDTKHTTVSDTKHTTASNTKHTTVTYTKHTTVLNTPTDTTTVTNTNSMGPTDTIST